MLLTKQRAVTFLTTPPLPENRAARCRELLGTAIALADDLLKQTKLPAAAILGKKGGSVTAKRGSDYFRKAGSTAKDSRRGKTPQR